MKPQIAIACDHAGYETKVMLIEHIRGLGYKIIDFGTDSTESVDYPDFGHKLGRSIEKRKGSVGISICGSGNGINMVSNKYKGVRAALCWNVEIAEMARKHNDANVCSLPARFITFELAKEITSKFLSTEFDSGRHERRKNKIDR